MTETRPTGVTVLAVLTLIGGILGVFAGAGMLFFGGATGATGAASGDGSMAGLGAGLLILGGVGLIASILNLFVAYGLFTLKQWAWTVAVVLQFVHIVINGANLLQGLKGVGSVIVAIVIAAVILYYLFQPHVKQAFGKA